MNVEAFRDQEQRQRVCRVLLHCVGLEAMWAPGGPSEEARALAAEGARTLSPEQRVFFLLAWAVASGEPTCVGIDELAELPETEPIIHLLLASMYGPDAIDAWLICPTGIADAWCDDTGEVHAQAARLFDEARAVFAENGEVAMNFRSPPDACALGAQRMADYGMIRGFPAIADDETRWRYATRLTVRMFETLAAIEHARAQSAEE